jgi:hypothetical protein
MVAIADPIIPVVGISKMFKTIQITVAMSAILEVVPNFFL